MDKPRYVRLTTEQTAELAWRAREDKPVPWVQFVDEGRCAMVLAHEWHAYLEMCNEQESTH